MAHVHGVRVIFARASCRYEGRISAELTLGDVVICLREPELGGDGSCLVLDPTKGMLPRNWMPGGSVISERPGGFIVQHRAKGEVLEIFVDEIYAQQTMEPEETGELRKLGAEREFSDLISVNLDRLGEPGRYELIDREWRTTAGPVDLLIADTFTGGIVAVEVKRNRITLADTWQARRYVSALIQVPPDEYHGKPVAGMLVAPVLAKNAKASIDSEDGLSFVRLAYKDLAEPEESDVGQALGL